MVRPRKSKTSVDKKLTEAELDLMNHLWKLGEGSVADILECVESRPKPAYTTVSTILRILEQKGIVSSRKEGRGHVYLPELSKQEYEASVLHHVVERVFDRTPSALVRRLIETEKLSEKELAELKELLERRTNS